MQFAEFSTDKLFEDFIGNKYTLVNVASMRARQINDGVEVYVRSRSKHPLQVALEEITAGYVGYTQGLEASEVEELEPETDNISFDEMINLDTDFDFDDEEAFDIEPMEFDDEYAGLEEEAGEYVAVE
ncbi:MAG: DNA-directed RNA polymerase subunit omega [bacterium]